MADDLKSLRDKIRETDDELLRLVQRRNELAKKVGMHKVANNIPIKNFQVEKEVMKATRQTARKIGLYEDMAEEFARLLIDYSVKAQEDLRSNVLKKNSKARKQILIVGGLGKMGQWLARFFGSFGHQISIYDNPKNLQRDMSQAFFTGDLVPAVKGIDVVILATPISKTAELIERLAAAKTTALVFDICSLKSPLLDSIKKAHQQGLRITSVHPMFGPDVRLLSGKNIVLCETENKKLSDETEDLFKDTAAKLVRVPLDKHDQMMSYVLGLSHMVNLGFAKVLAESGFTYKQLRDVASSTFFSQLEVVSPVVGENQDLYYEIQSENKHSEQIIRSMVNELQNYLTCVVKQDRGLFKQYMERSRSFIHDKPI